MTNVDNIAKGLEGIVVENTSLSKVDGTNGVLIYRGYHIDQIAKCTYEEICHLFLFGELPSRKLLEAFEGKLKKERAVPKEVLRFIESAPPSDHPMAMLRTSVSMLSGYLDELGESSRDSKLDTAIALIAKTATIAAAIARVKKGLKPVDPNNDLGHAANYLFMSTGEIPDDVVAKTLDTALVLHADHGFNVSTFSARVVTSSLSDMVSAVTAAIGSLKGPLHGGANTAVMEMLLSIGEVEKASEWVLNALKEKKKIMGFGHRVYRTLDPRAKHLKQMSKEWCDRAGESKWFKMSQVIEDLMTSEKGISANVDFYSATTYYSMGIQPELFTVIFAMARMVGWTSHIIEQLEDNKLMRPKAQYTGSIKREFRSLDERAQ